MSRHNLKQGAPALAAAIALTVIAFILGAMTATPVKGYQRHSPLPSACTTIAEIDASGNDAHVGPR